MQKQKNMDTKKVVVLGAGNVATHLAQALNHEGYSIVQIFSRTMRSAVELASVFECGFTTEINEISQDADIYVVSISDSAVRSVLLSLPVKDKLVIHTAGSVNINIFSDTEITKYGVFYPLQTFSKFKPVNFHEIPIFVEGSSEETEEEIFNLARTISPKVYRCESQKRIMLHLSAVFACNFTNHMLAIAEDIIKDNKLPSDILKPLIKETFDKVMKFPAMQSQTGPAVRNDKNIVNKHLDLLTSSDNYKTIYEVVSKSIWDLKQKHNG